MKSQHLACGKSSFPQNFRILFHRSCGKLDDKNLCEKFPAKAQRTQRLIHKKVNVFTSNTVLFFDVLQIVVSLLQNRAGAAASVHIADVAFFDHCVENRGGASVADAEMALQEGGRGFFRHDDGFESLPE